MASRVPSTELMDPQELPGTGWDKWALIYQKDARAARDTVCRDREHGKLIVVKPGEERGFEDLGPIQEGFEIFTQG